MGAQVRWADLTDAAAVEALVNEIEPAVIIHLAALIPPVCYARPALARKINVDATATLVHAASALPTRPRFILASSIAVYGARNPHTFSDRIATDTPLQARDLYGAHKIEAEDLLRSSDLTWVVLRLGGVIGPEPLWKASADVVAFQAMLPIDGRVHTVDIRDLARAFAEATTTHATREAFLIGGPDASSPAW
jgi:nucleoside-diphosphate-sugar epimerase